MGLLDGVLGNLFSDDPQKQANLYMALGLLGGSGKTNRNFGADLGNAGLLGANAYAQAKQTQLLSQKEALQNSLLGLQAKTAQQQYDEGQQARNIIRGGMPQQGDVTADMVPPQFQPQAPQGMPSVVPGVGPKAPAMVAQSPAGASNSKFDTFNRYNTIADKLEAAGLIDQAKQYRDTAEKYRPKLKDEQVRLGPDGKPAVVRNYEDGTTEVSPFSPTANLQYLDVKNAKLPINNYTGQMGGQPIPMGMDPAEAQRLAIERGRLGNENARTFFETGMGGGGGRAGAPAGTPNLPPAVAAQIAKSQAEGLNTGGVAYKNNLDSVVNTGNDLMTRISESRKALEQFKPGMGAEAFLNIARAAKAANMPDGLVSRIAGGDVASIQEFQKLSAQQAMETLKSAMGGSGRITQAEFKVFQANNPNIELDREAINKIYGFAENTHRRNVAEQSALTQYLRGGGNVSEWPTVWTQQTGAGLQRPGAPKIGAVEQGYTYIGGDPSRPGSWKRAP